MNPQCKAAANALLSMQRYSWEQGVAMQAFLGLGEVKTVICMAQDAICRQTEDGRAAVVGVSNAVTDPVSVGRGLLAAWRHTADANLQDGLEKLKDWAIKCAPRNADGVVFHMSDSKQMWVDSLYMLPPFLAACDEMELALKNLYGYMNLLRDEKAGLMRHIWDDEGKRFADGDFWGVGNGWALAGMTDVQSQLPAGKNQIRIRSMIQSLLDALRPLMRTDGLYHNVVDDESSFVETNLSQMILYVLYTGLSQGWLEAGYETWAACLRTAVEGKVDAYGYVRDVCGAPRFNAPGIAPEGQAFFLLMESAYEKWRFHKPL